MKLHSIDQIWNLDESSLTRRNRWFIRILKRGVIVYDGIMRDNTMSYASALTYSSLLAAIPVLAIIFAIAKGFGFSALIEDRLRESLQVSPEIIDTIMSFVNSYLEHTQGGIFIGVGLILLFYTLISLTANVETAFNTIWKVYTSRNIYRRVTDYISVFILLPFIIVISSGVRLYLMTITSFLPNYFSHTVTFTLKVIPMLLTCAAFVMLYKLMPNTKVKLKNALMPGICAGIVFLIVQYFYLHYQIKLSSYNAIYGSFAAIPMLMLWLHISWCVCLIGGQLSYANQNIDDYAFERNSQGLSRRYRDSLSLLIMCRICKRFKEGSAPFTLHSLARDTHLPQNLVRMLLNELVEMQLLVEVHTETGTTSHYLPAFDINRMTTQMIMRHIDSYGAEQLSRSWQLSTEEWNAIRKLRNHKEDCLLIDL